VIGNLRAGCALEHAGCFRVPISPTCAPSLLRAEKGKLRLLGPPDI
jgi:hypothetical protein